MSENNEEPKEEPLNETPPPLQPNNLLNSIFRDGGPMPPAKIWLRAAAYALDLILLFSLCLLLIWKIAIPQAYPGASSELMELLQGNSLFEFVKEWSAAETPSISISENLIQAFAYSIQLLMIAFWFYFSIGEAFFGGSSLGKRLLRIRTVSTVTLDRPPILIGIVRGGTKAFLAFIPLGLLINLCTLFFNKRRQLAHDLLSRTAVVDEKYVNLTPER